MERIFIHFGSDKEFKKKISNIQDSVYLSEIVDILTRREIEIANVPRQPQNPLFVENLIIHTDDYGGINEWATLGFSHRILENKRLNIKNVWINNPTRKIYQDLNKVYGEKIEQIMEPLKSIDL